MQITINNINICPYCLGGGKLKAMQSVVTNIESVRGNDTKVKCSHCDGTGIKYEIN